MWYPFCTKNVELGSEDKIGQGKGKGFNVNLRLDKQIKDGDMLVVFDFLFLPRAHKF
jgi:acetoin utilization deacetylase AcuC-like enzyme